MNNFTHTRKHTLEYPSTKIHKNTNTRKPNSTDISVLQNYLSGREEAEEERKEEEEEKKNRERRSEKRLDFKDMNKFGETASHYEENP